MQIKVLSNKGVGGEKQVGGFCIPVETPRFAIIVRAPGDIIIRASVTLGEMVCGMGTAASTSS